MPKLGLGPAGLKTSRKSTGLELPSFPAVSLEEKLMLERRLPSTPVLCRMQEHGTLVHDMASWQSSTELKRPGCILQDTGPKRDEYKHPLFQGAALDWDWPELVSTGTRTTSTASPWVWLMKFLTVMLTTDLLRVFSKPTDPSYVLRFHICKSSQSHSVVTDL